MSLPQALRRAGLRWVVALLAGCGGQALHCADYIAREWLVEDGLPYNAVNTIVRDARGFLWLGTPGGLARFDGHGFETFAFPKELTGGGQNIRALLAGGDGRSMLMITAGNHVLRLRDGVFSPHPVNGRTGDGTLRDIALDAGGALWLGTTEPAVFRWKDNRLERFGAEQGITRRTGPFGFVPGAGGRTWVGGGGFLGWYEDGRLHRYRGPWENATFIAPARDGGLWVATPDGLARGDGGGNWREVLSGKAWLKPAAGMQTMFEERDGGLWVATRHDGLYHFSDGKLAPVPIRQTRVMSINDDAEGNIWLGVTGGGLTRLRPKNHIMLNTASGLPHNTFASVCEDAAGNVWCADIAGHVSRVDSDGGHPEPVSTPPGGSSPFVSTLCADAQGRLWAGATDGLYVPDPGAPRFLRHARDDIANVQTLFPARDGALWIGFDYGRLAVLRADGTLRRFTAEDGLGGGRVAGVAERADGGIWVATETGRLFEIARGRLEERLLPGSVLPVRIHALLVDHADRLWLATNAGLVLFRGPDTKVLTQKDGLPDELINQIVADRRRRLWVASRRGLFRADLDGLAAAADGAPGAVAVRFFGAEDELAGLSGLVSGQPMAWAGKERVWLVTYRGIVGFDMDAPRQPAPPVPVYIDRIAADRTPAPAAPDGIVRTPPAPGQVAFHFSVLNFSTPERTRVRRKLEGFDPDWIEAGRERVCVYSRLPAGRYVFRAEAGDGDGRRLSETSATLIVPPAWWETWWARSAIAAALLATLAWWTLAITNRVLRRRLRQLEQENALQRERSRIARDLHDDLGGRATKINLVASNLQAQMTEPAAREALGRLVTQSRRMVEDLERIIWTVNSQNNSWRKLAGYISQSVRRHLQDTGVACTVTGGHTIPDQSLTPETQHHLLAMTKEALNNVLKHSRATHAEILLKTEDDRFHLRIEDDGIGFDPDDPAHQEHNGLANMRARAAEVGGTLQIESRAGAGAAILITVPLRPPARRK